MNAPVTSKHRVWIAMKGNEQSLRLAESDGWEVHEVAKAPACRPNSLENIHRDMDLLQQIHRDSLVRASHRGIAREGDSECTDGDCWCHDPAQNPNHSAHVRRPDETSVCKWLRTNRGDGHPSEFVEANCGVSFRVQIGTVSEYRFCPSCGKRTVLQGSSEEPECQHDLLKPNTTIEVIDPWKAKCKVCIEFFDLRPEKAACCDGSGRISYVDDQGRQRVKRCNVCQPAVAALSEKASGESRAEFERDRGFVRRCLKCGEQLVPYAGCPKCDVTAENGSPATTVTEGK